jgi:hypothetical protein
VITREFMVTHFSLIGFDGHSDLWLDFMKPDIQNHRYSSERLRPSFKGCLWHMKFPQCEAAQLVVKVTSDFTYWAPAAIEFQGKKYVGVINPGFDVSFLGFRILGRECGIPYEVDDVNEVKLYTSVPISRSDYELKKPIIE